MLATINEVIGFRDVLFQFFLRDIKLKYKRTVLGYLWSFLNPLLNLLILAAVFSQMIGRNMKNYPQFLFSGLLVWTFFESSLLMSVLSFVENDAFIRKVYLPKIIFPLNKVLSRLLDFVLAFFAMEIIGLVMGFEYHATLFLLPFAVILFFFFTLGISFIVSTAVVFFRDVDYLLSVFTRLLYFLTPILYPIDALPPKIKVFMRFNLLYPFMEVFHKLIYSGVCPSAFEWLNIFVIAAVVFALGVYTIKSLEQQIVLYL